MTGLVIWLIAAVLLAIGELVTPGMFFLGPVALAAVGAAVMVGDSIEDDVEGAKAVGMRGLLLDRENRYPEVDEKLTDLLALPAALGLSPA